MAINTPKTVAFTGGKIIETPTSTGTATDITTLAGTLTGQIESVHNNVFTLAPSAADQTIYLGNITTAKLLVLNPDNSMQVKFNGSSTAITLNAGPSVFFATISGVVATNPSATATVQCELYASTDVG